jgi:ribosomal-protein-alanine N-acetyltransferase
MNNIRLELTENAYLEHFFRFQCDEEARLLAAFMSENSTDKAAFLEKWQRFLTDPSINHRTIFVGDEIVGSVSKFVLEGDAQIAYWIDKKWWGKGIATHALKEFLTIESIRPLFLGVAFDNIGSQRVAEKSGFTRIRTETSFATARQAEIQEYIYRID